MFLYTDDTRCELLPLHVVTVGTDHEQTLIDRPSGFWAHHMFCIEEGSGVFETPQGTYPLEAGTVIFIRKDYPTRYYPTGEVFKVGFVTFDGTGVEHLLQYYRAEDFMFVKSDTLVSMMGHCARLGAHNAEPDKLSCALYEILVRFFSELYSKQATPSFVRAKNYIEQHCYDPELSVSEVAREIGISPSLLFRLFREEEHTTPIDFLRRTRIRRAKQLLLQSPALRISEVAVRCGFSNCAYFCKVFKDLTDLTPKEFSATYIS
ncbi:MAG: helix-turn-helix domain-containing protein [Clostridia bacterium]|nr:helix-turn-helix domain-containing protein [Clostridia bacterium]